jgi:hypothetical protein
MKTEKQTSGMAGAWECPRCGGCIPAALADVDVDDVDGELALITLRCQGCGEEWTYGIPVDEILSDVNRPGVWLAEGRDPEWMEDRPSTTDLAPAPDMSASRTQNTIRIVLTPGRAALLIATIAAAAAFLLAAGAVLGALAMGGGDMPPAAGECAALPGPHGVALRGNGCECSAYTRTRNPAGMAYGCTPCARNVSGGSGGCVPPTAGGVPVSPLIYAVIEPETWNRKGTER